MTDEERQAEIERLEALLAASDGQPGYKERCDAIRAKLAELNAE